VKPVLLDTGCIVALLDRSEQNHRRCAEVVTELDAPLVTCEAVIAEACYLLRGLRGAGDAVLENVERGTFEIPFRLDRASRAIRLLMRRYASVPMDFADACLVHLADELDTGRILTFDEDFTVYRWRRSRAFDRLLSDRGT
jgi:predicted nucleic acid-binding protein